VRDRLVLRDEDHAVGAQSEQQVVHLQAGERLGQGVLVLQIHRRPKRRSISRRFGLNTAAPA
jgi:hypothetical protein